MRGLRFKDFVLTSRDLEYVEVCPATRSLVLVKREPPHPGMVWGIHVHRFLEIAYEEGRAVGLSYLRRAFPRALGQCSRLDIDELPAGGKTEVEVLTDAFEPRAAYASYKKADPARHWYGRADLLRVQDRTAHVIDFKTGKAPPQVENNDQLTLLALGVACIEKLVEVTVSICQVYDGRFRWATATRSKEQLDAFAKRLREAHAEVNRSRDDVTERGEEIEFRPGPWCARCELNGVCPAYKP